MIYADLCIITQSQGHYMNDKTVKYLLFYFFTPISSLFGKTYNVHLPKMLSVYVQVIVKCAHEANYSFILNTMIRIGRLQKYM